MSTTSEEIDIPIFRTRKGLREEARSLRERSKQLRADSQRLKVKNSVIAHDILAISVHVNEIIFNLERPPRQQGSEEAEHRSRITRNPGC